ncbi:sensor histidine kinase [Pedobacter insulae]|uniref:Histidine kinase n=1 Tax=Pedobacter insulae TaxID=414048 RepID=A0A1I2ZVC9_9SPHI|nr:histidine kinase [Pedobacter insulae]SFH41630.1 Histidine kinase [Pedobacter insulae]
MNFKDLQKIEFWVATGLYLLVIFLMVINIDSDTLSGRFYSRQIYSFKNAGINFSYLPHYFLPKLLSTTYVYLVFLLLNFYLIPTLIRQTNLILNTFLLLSVFFLYGLFMSIGYTYSQAYLLVEYNNITEAYTHLFVKGFAQATYIILMFSFYVLTKTFLPKILTHFNQKYQHPKILNECVIAFVAYVFILFLLGTQTDRDYYGIIWAFVVPLGILHYGYSLYRLIPDLKNMNIGFWGFLWRSILLLALTGAIVAAVAMIFSHDDETWPIIFSFNMGVHCFFTTPLIWVIYNYRLKNKSEISFLKKELGKSDASLSFLQSQINPHFLFNALNTLYGTALQENAERTGEGIQKLGDMMRFMLHENVQEKISLTRDIDYLENYISLQKLRTSRSADIAIETKIDEQLNNFQIAPMLLIPFVENAFKHGISLQHPSHIKITLQTKENTLYFDVHNSIHIKPDHDPEKLKSGIGLENVKQRLVLLYPGKHELIIRESAKEFFIHLTLQL